MRNSSGVALKLSTPPLFQTILFGEEQPPSPFVRSLLHVITYHSKTETPIPNTSIHQQPIINLPSLLSQASPKTYHGEKPTVTSKPPNLASFSHFGAKTKQTTRRISSTLCLDLLVSLVSVHCCLLSLSFTLSLFCSFTSRTPDPQSSHNVSTTISTHPCSFYTITLLISIRQYPSSDMKPLSTSR